MRRGYKYCRVQQVQQSATFAYKVSPPNLAVLCHEGSEHHPESLLELSQTTHPIIDEKQTLP